MFSVVFVLVLQLSGEEKVVGEGEEKGEEETGGGQEQGGGHAVVLDSKDRVDH